jgi:serine/threonine protein kinase
VSPLARDLIQRILRANPLERLRVAEIRRHPWLRKELPIYANLSFFSDALQEREAEVDSDLLETVRGYEMESLKGMDDNERIAKIIKRRMDDSFVTAYELLRDE